MSRSAGAIAVVALVLVAACGQKGPLHFPGEGPEPIPAPGPVPEEEGDEDTEGQG